MLQRGWILLVDNQDVLGLREINAGRKTEQNHKCTKLQGVAYVEWLNLFCEFLLNKQTRKVTQKFDRVCSLGRAEDPYHILPMCIYYLKPTALDLYVSIFV